MQPYFVPYAGYFRLFAAADAVVMFDCVQFPRRGWVHRNRLPTTNGTLDWLTLPLTKAPYDARIMDLRFPGDASVRLQDAMRRFPILGKPPIADEPLLAQIGAAGGDVVDYLIGIISGVCERLNLKTPFMRSSSLGLPDDLHAQDRVIAIARHLGATCYVNPPGGRALYDADAFANAGMKLRFLTPYGGAEDSILARLLTEPRAAIAREILERSTTQP